MKTIKRFHYFLWSLMLPFQLLAQSPACDTVSTKTFSALVPGDSLTAGEFTLMDGLAATNGEYVSIGTRVVTISANNILSNLYFLRQDAAGNVLSTPRELNLIQDNQVIFINSFSDNNGQAGAQIIEIFDAYGVSLGYVISATVYIPAVSSNNLQVMLARVDHSGHLLWARFLPNMQASTESAGLVQRSDNHHIVVLTAYREDPNLHNTMALEEWSISGALLNQRSFPLNTPDIDFSPSAIAEIQLAGQPNFAVAGTYKVANQQLVAVYFLESGLSSAYYVFNLLDILPSATTEIPVVRNIRVTPSGIVLAGDLENTATPNDDAGFLIGTSYPNGAGQVSSRFAKRYFRMNLADHNQSFRDVETNSAGEIIIAASHKNPFVEASTPYLLKCDPAGNFLWAQELNLNYNGDLNDKALPVAVDITQDNGIWVGGNATKSTLPYRDFSVKTDAAGNLHNCDCAAPYSPSHADLFPGYDIFDYTESVLLNQMPEVLLDSSVVLPLSPAVCDQYCPPDSTPGCQTSTCFRDSLIINTGYDVVSDMPYLTGQYDAFWTLAQTPDVDANIPRPAFVIPPFVSWATFPQAQWLSAYPQAEHDMNNTDPYVFKRCFCICDDSVPLIFNFQLLADDSAQVYLSDEYGHHLKYFGSAIHHLTIDTLQDDTLGFAFQVPKHILDTCTLNKGTYCLEVDLWNTNGVATGFDMQGSIKGGALISEQCCNPNSTITGAKFHDINCNGIWDFFDKDPLHPEKEPGLAGWTIQLCDSTGQLIASTQTDVFGYYTFFGIPPGDYSVKEVLQPDWVVDAPVGGVFPVQLDTLKVVGFLNFGNKYVGPLSFRDTFDCVVIGQEEAITWQGSPCDCPVTITLQNCDGGGEIILAAGLANTGTYYWTIPAVPEGFYQISIRNCDSTDTIISPCFEIRPGNIPTIQCPPNVTIDCSQSGYMLPDATFTTDCPCDPNHTPVYSKRYHGPYRCGLNTLTASIADKCGQASCTVTVTVLDTIPPTVVCPADLTLHTLPGLCYATSELPAVTGQDNCTNMPQITCFLVELGDTIPVTGENQFNLGVHTIFCSAKDNCGNLSATCQYNLTVVDDVPPTLICPADVTVTGSTVPDGVCRAVVNNIAAFATDNCFGVSLYYSLPGGVSGPGDASGNIFQGGPSTVFYTAIDLSGHPTFCAFQVTVLCPDSCCAGEEAFLAKVAAGFSVQRFDCGFQLKPVALSDCQLLNIQWGDGQTTGPVPANSHYSHTYAASGDYAICVKVEEFNNAGVACYSKDTCWTVCVQCDTCTMKTIDLDWYQDVAPTYSNFSGNNSNYYISYDPASDNFYVTGAFIGSAYKHNQVPQSPAASNTIGQNGFVSTYSRIGGALTSYFPFSSGSNFWENVQGAVIKPDPATHGFYLAGAFYGQVINLLADGSGLSFPIIASNVSPSHPNVFLARYNGVTDSWWGFAIGGNNDEQLNDLEIDSDGNIIIIGSAIGSIEFNPNGASVPVNSDDPFIYTAKYDPNGILIWVDIINDANVGEKDKGLGLTVDKLTNDIFICGEFYGHPEVFTKSQSSLSPSVSLGITTLSVLGSTGTPFAAKLFSSGAPGWAIGIQNTAKTSSGAAWDIDWEGDYVYLSGTVIESNTDEVEYGPLNSSLNTRKSGVRNYLVKYNKSNGYFICADWSLPANTLPAGTAIEEISILNNTLYLSGSRGNNMYVAIYGTDCNRLKSFETFGTDGLTDVSYSIAPDPFGGFAIVGNFTGPVFDPDPQANNNPEITTSSAGYNLFVGKYSCNCPKDSIEESCCEKLMVMAKKSPENSCCYTIDLKNNAGFDIHSLEVVLQTADWEFNNVQIGNGFTATQIGQLITLSGSPVIPAGTSPAAFLFCLKSLNTTASHAQTIIFNWYETLAGGKKHLICSDTLLSDCAPTCACSVWSPVTVKNKALNFGTSLNCTGQQPYPVLPCPAAAHPHTFSGQLRCTSCRASSISWTLLNPNSLPVLSNSTVGPFYSFQVPRFALTVAGVYTLLLRGVCGSDSCQCMVRFVSNGCPKLCPCDSTFPKSINPNFIVKSKKNCGWSFQAAAMSECDSVTFWIKPESGNQPAIALGPTLGTGIVLSGSLSGFYYIWMTVTRTDSDGLRCSISTRWKRQFFGCLMAGLVCDNNGILNGGFSEGATAGILGQGGMSAGWQRVAGEPEVVPDLSCGNPVSMRLRGNCLGRDIITGKTPMTIQADSNYQFHFCYKSTSPAPLPGTALVVTLTDSLQTTPDCAGNCVEFGRFDLTAIDSDWYEADGILTAPSGLSSAYLNLQVENDLALDDPDSRSAVLIDNLCLDKDLFIVSIKEPVETNGFRIFPNPNTGTFQLAFSQAVKPGAFFRIIGISGQALQTGQLDAGLRQQEIDTRNLPGGLYFLEIVSATGVHEIRKFVKQ